jgi:hypothetical protein
MIKEEGVNRRGFLSNIGMIHLAFCILPTTLSYTLLTGSKHSGRVP